jgi:hypothetical protein
MDGSMIPKITRRIRAPQSGQVTAMVDGRLSKEAGIPAEVRVRRVLILTAFAVARQRPAAPRADDTPVIGSGRKIDATGRPDTS